LIDGKRLLHRQDLDRCAAETRPQRSMVRVLAITQRFERLVANRSGWSHPETQRSVLMPQVLADFAYSVRGNQGLAAARREPHAEIGHPRHLRDFQKV